MSEFEIGDRVVLKHGVGLGYKHEPRLRGHILRFGYSGGRTAQFYVNEIRQPIVRLEELEHESAVEQLGRIADE